ncbi:MAG: DeoR/GlpR family DNA-binding transcription regulator [Promethearchaeota archaeon]
MIGTERRIKISELVKGKGSISIEELMNRFNVSRMTIWRDLKILEKEGLLKKVYGGAIRPDRMGPEEKIFEIKRKKNLEEKRSIAEHATNNYVKEEYILFLDGGTTTLELIPYLTKKNITILTNGLNTLLVASKYLPDLNVIGTGGVLRKPSLTFVGPETERFLEQYRADIAFISGTGLTIEDGLTDPHPLEMEAKKVMCKNAKKIIVLLDSSKFYKRSLSTLIGIDEIDVLITDNKAPPEFIEELQKRNVKVDVVKS